jgi:broad specificity phosphatase PhoE
MKHIRLLRHGPVEPEYAGRYIGVTDVPLSARGEKEMEMLGRIWQGRFEKAVSSPLSRCKRSAACFLGENSGLRVEIHADLSEINLGSWENRSIDLIRKEQPGLYEARGKALGRFRTPQGESFEDTADRGLRVLQELARQRDEEILAVTHAGLIRACLCRLRGQSCDHVFDYAVPFSSWTTLGVEEDGRLKVEDIGVRDECLLDEEEIARLYQKYQTPAPVIRHMAAVRQTCDELLDRLKDGYDRGQLDKAALVHDLCRRQPHHEEVSAAALRREGYPAIAALVRAHNDEELEEGPLTAAELLFYADKITRQDQRVTLAERFAQSRAKCTTPEALEHHERRRRKALAIEEKIRRMEKEKKNL